MSFSTDLRISDNLKKETNDYDNDNDDRIK